MVDGTDQTAARQMSSSRMRCPIARAAILLEKRLVEENRAKGGAIQLPEAVPLGKASLWWPPSVPYRSPQVDVNIFAESCNEENGVTAMLSETSIEPSPLLPIYPSSLGSNHFRLIYLTESGDVSSPIHFRLEEYAFDDYPISCHLLRVPPCLQQCVMRMSSAVF